MNELIVTVITILVVLGVIVTACMYLVLAERKVSAWMQDRIGPNRVGPYGLFQPVADGLKILLKEGIVPFGPVDKTPLPNWFRFIIAPNVDIGLVFIFAVGSLAVYGVILGGWASN